MRKLLTILVFATLAVATAQEKEQPRKGPALTAKVFEVKPGNAERIALALRQLGLGTVNWTPGINVVAVRAEPELMPALEEVIKRLDATPSVERNVELTVFLVEGLQQGGADTTLPADLQPVIKQLRGVFSFQSFRLLDTLFLRTRDAQSASTSGVLSAGGRYEFRCRPGVRGGDKDRTVRVDNLILNTRVPVPLPTVTQGQPPQYTYAEGRIDAEFDMKEGQKIVVGKTSIQGAERALILVVSGKIIE